MKNRLDYRLLLVLITALVLIPSISSFADTTRYEYNDSSRMMKVQTGGGTAIITASAGPGGSISPAGTIGVRYTDSQTFTITPDPHYHITDVKVDNVQVGAVSSYTFSNAGGNHTIHAEFAKDTYTLNVSLNDTAGGMVTSAPAGVTCGSDCSESYDYDKIVTLAASPNTGYDFLGWTGACGGTGTCSLIMDSNKEVTANFAIRMYTIAASAGDDGKGSITPAGNVTVNHGSSQTFVIAPNAGYSISDVMVDGVSRGAEAAYTFSDVVSSHTITASFSCPNGPVRINSATPQYFTTLQAAYNAAVEGDLIQVHGITFNESLIISKDIAVAIDGGYACDYSTKSGFTTLIGSLQTTLGGGTLTLRNFLVTAGTTAVSTTATPPGGTYNIPQNVTLTCTGSCAATYYTTDGSTPAPSSTQYTGPIAISENAILKFFSTDTSGRREAVRTEFYIIDSSASQGMVKINSDAVATNSTGVTLSLTCNDSAGCSQMQFSNDGSAWSAPEVFASTKAWALAAGSDGIRTVYAKFKDSAGNWSSAFSDTIVLDTIAPVTTASLPAGTYNTAIEVALKCSDYAGSGCDKVYYTTDGSTPGTASAQYTGAIALSATATVKYFAVDRAGNQEAVQSRTYTLDTAAPAGTVVINGGAAATNSRSVTLTLTCTDNASCTQMHFSNDNAVWSKPETFAATKAWTLTAGDEEKTVYARFKDSAGNWSPLSPSIKDTIRLDTGAPTTTATPAGGAYSATVDVSLTCTEGGSGAGCDRTFYTTDGSTPTTSSPVYSAPIVVLTTTTLKFFSIDFAGNQEAVKSETYAISPIRIANTGHTYTSLQDAYNAAADNDTIQVQGTYLVQNLNVNRNIAVTLDGGHSNDFSTKSGFTTLKGQVQTFAGGGTLTLKNFMISY
ncbi:MAG: chitobiase/beta-hexosaminidase C-terminal domain-containing protein [Nitrospirota bacterium]